MHNYKFSHTYFFKGLLAVAFALALFALTPQLASAQAPCFDQGLTCTAKDLGPFEILSVTDIQSPCTDLDASIPGLEIRVDITYRLNAGSAQRYDLGLTLARDGRNILSATDPATSCISDYLTPLTLARTGVTNWPVDGYFWDNEEAKDPTDVCGDLGSTDTATRTLDNVVVSCVDTDGDGKIDVSICQVYDNNFNTYCGATGPGTGSKCDCFRMALPITPTAIEGLTFSASSRALPVGLALSGLGLLLIAGVLLTVYLRRRAHA